MYVIRGKGFTCKVGDPITNFIVTRRDDAALFSVQGVADREGCPIDVEMGRQVRWFDAIA